MKRSLYVKRYIYFTLPMKTLRISFDILVLRAGMVHRTCKQVTHYS